MQTQNCRSSGEAYHFPEKKNTFSVSPASQEWALRCLLSWPHCYNPLLTVHIQGKDRDREAHSAGEKATSLLHKLEEAISEQRKLQTINTELSNTCQALQQKTRKLKTTIESLQKRLIEGEHHGLLFQSFLDEEFPHYDSLSCTDAIQQPLQEKLKQCCHKLYGGQEGRIHQTPLTLKHTCWYTPLLDALSLDSFTAVPTLESTPFSGVANQTHTLCERPTYGEVKDGALDITRQHKCPGPTSGPNPGTNLSGYIRMNDDPSMEENGVERVCSESLLQSREYSSLPFPRHTSSTDSTITSSDPGLEILNMASCDLDSNSLCKKEEDTRTASPMTEAQGTNPAHDNTAFQDSASKDKTTLNLEAKEEPETIEEHKKECASGGKECFCQSPCEFLFSTDICVGEICPNKGISQILHLWIRLIGPIIDSICIIFKKPHLHCVDCSIPENL